MLTREVLDYVDPQSKELVSKILCKEHKKQANEYYHDVLLPKFAGLWRDWIKAKTEIVFEIAKENPDSTN